MPRVKVSYDPNSENILVDGRAYTPLDIHRKQVEKLSNDVLAQRVVKLTNERDHCTRESSELKAQVEQLRERVKQLEALASYAATEMIKTTEEKNALVAQVETLKHVALELSGVISEYQQMQEKSLRVRMFDTNRRYMNRITATPAQCLAEIKAQAYKDGYVAALITYTDEPTAWCNEQAWKHLEQLRQQVNTVGCYFDADGMLRNADGSRSIFDDVDE